MRFRAGQHLRRSEDFALTRAEGLRHDGGSFVAWFRRRPLTTPKGATTSSDVITASEARARSVGQRPARPRPAPPPADERRLGLIASKAAVGNAVARNRARRRLRELFRLHQLTIPEGCDVVLSARRSVVLAPQERLDASFEQACSRACRELGAKRP